MNQKATLLTLCPKLYPVILEYVCVREEKNNWAKSCYSLFCQPFWGLTFRENSKGEGISPPPTAGGELGGENGERGEGVGIELLGIWREIFRHIQMSEALGFFAHI
jgi:hypothetical protein